MASNIDTILKKSAFETDVNKLISLGKQINKVPKNEFEQDGFSFVKMAILTNYSSQLLIPLIQLFAAKEKIHLTVFESEYGLAESVIYSKDEALKKFAPDICYFCVGTDHLNEIGRA